MADAIGALATPAVATTMVAIAACINVVIFMVLSSVVGATMVYI
ncbi:hypothetical protein [Mycobacterium kansasii]|uniref:Putative membrane protein n=2 Tax=Mycobacterium kansasii TaxID=1768 RepID=A0A1V3X8Y2_MYCKA|nr:hypothetical protein [Mycobacterium kansasii]EUA03924.1 putative membrane protein [Mycobacterium kansasii 824]EUA16373.1 putative membrane protein [Mycobacterium kansasii 662]KEP39091.1 hypothetical protein MKSMC1_57600 [Mycobacterium kansasii]OOK72765.1 putative membrane protein [Mycobacterium kansasii]OOK75694.1 putative membrane protein [Mycobacterium kansasii]